MMDFLADTWVLAMMIWLICVIGMVYYRQTGRGMRSTFTSADDFSVRTIFLNFQKGEGDLFFGFLLAMLSFSFFVLGFTHWFRTMLQ